MNRCETEIATERREEKSATESRSAFRLPELLAPAGDWECAKAAVENGADAIYFGLEKFNARMRARNFTEADLPKLTEFLHRRGVKGYVTFNTLVFANEMPEAEQYLRTIISAGVDAAIVQDVGICRLIRRLSPDFPIHASTQMTITSAAGVDFARELGCNLVVLARENSLKEIGRIQSAMANGQSAIPLEVFVHGALCVAYSGQCLTSEALGGRSANRGECAQACRMPYELICDDKLMPLGDRRYLLSPQDLAGLEVLPELVRLGVASLKIEGRLKSPEYVANITRAYRQALDQLRLTIEDLRAPGESPVRLERASTRQSSTANRKSFSPPVVRYELEMAFSRGLSTGWLHGINNQELVHARFGKKRGVYLGDVMRVQGDKVFMRLEGPLKPGDGIVFDAGHPDQKEEGGRVYEIRNSSLPGPNPREAMLSFGRGDINFSRVQSGDKVWKTDDPNLNRRWRATFESEHPQFQRPLDFEAHGGVGRPLTLVVRDKIGHVVQVESLMPLEEAQKQPLTVERLRAQMGRLGGTAFHLGELKNFVDANAMLPVSELNRLRREAVRLLDAARAQPKRWTLNSGLGIDDLRVKEAGEIKPIRQSPNLIVLVRSLTQLEAALGCGVPTIYCEFEDPKKY
ncbi:MAG: peptidase U32, partial [Verrucomicrobia bacterium]